jgi:ribosomal protein L16/L10AE
MLMPKRVKYRKVQRGRMCGETKGLFRLISANGGLRHLSRPGLLPSR